MDSWERTDLKQHLKFSFHASSVLHYSSSFYSLTLSADYACKSSDSRHNRDRLTLLEDISKKFLNCLWASVRLLSYTILLILISDCLKSSFALALVTEIADQNFSNSSEHLFNSEIIGFDYVNNTKTYDLSLTFTNGTAARTLAGLITTTHSPQLTANDTDIYFSEFVLPPFNSILVSIVLLFVILGTIVGNVLVCIAVCMVRKLRRPCNYLLVSLALSDLCVAVLVMPMALLYEVLEKWNFGPLLCDIWVSFDVLCCTASILNLCAISVDRYLAITKPLEYGVKRTPRRMMLCVALVWLAAACISLPPLLILGNEHVDESGDPTCAVCQNFAYQIYATLGSFYIPLSVMLFVYYQIFRAARRIVLEEKRAQTHLQHALNGTGSPTGHTNLDFGDNGQHRHSSYGNTSLNYSTCGGLSTGQGGGSGSSGLLGSPHHKKLRFQLAKEKKASTTLGIIMSAFTICWLPFFILALIRPFVESESVHVPQSLSSLFLWLGYANSLLNPIIYATLNRDFRKPFQEILYFRCSSLNTMMRENYYQDQYGEPPSQRVMLGDERHGARESFL
uniref:G-protein coupled receptors family 1 profile domain-containing protein n=1 Tax=Glossina austeni TaxID=7395 RepID=A0A1A9V3H1_GLOAU